MKYSKNRLNETYLHEKIKSAILDVMEGVSFYFNILTPVENFINQPKFHGFCCRHIVIPFGRKGNFLHAFSGISCQKSV